MMSVRDVRAYLDRHVASVREHERHANAQHARLRTREASSQACTHASTHSTYVATSTSGAECERELGALARRHDTATPHYHRPCSTTRHHCNLAHKGPTVSWRAIMQQQPRRPAIERLHA
jgi:hypothetical protein